LLGSESNGRSAPTPTLGTGESSIHAAHASDVSNSARLRSAKSRSLTETKEVLAVRLEAFEPEARADDRDGVTWDHLGRSARFR